MVSFDIWDIQILKMYALFIWYSKLTRCPKFYQQPYLVFWKVCLEKSLAFFEKSPLERDFTELNRDLRNGRKRSAYPTSLQPASIWTQVLHSSSGLSGNPAPNLSLSFHQDSWSQTFSYLKIYSLPWLLIFPTLLDYFYHKKSILDPIFFVIYHLNYKNPIKALCTIVVSAYLPSIFSSNNSRMRSHY